MIGNDELLRWPCRSFHRLTVSLDGVKPLTVTLPYPLLPDTIKATLRQKDNIVEVVAAKATNDIWPEDVIRDQFRWNAENLERCTDAKRIISHLESQFRESSIVPGVTRSVPGDLLSKMRLFITNIFCMATEEKKQFFELRSEGPPETSEWLIRVHLPVRISPRGAPILLLSVLDKSQVADQTPQGQDELKRILCDGDVSKRFAVIFLHTEEVQLFRKLWRYIFRFNSTKIQPTEWQKKNLPQGGDSPWLATFIQPLYFDGPIPNPDAVGACGHCGKPDAQKKCGRCHSAPYCSVECQRAHWPTHKLSCSK